MADTLTVVERTMFLMELQLFRGMKSQDLTLLAGSAEESYHDAGSVVRRFDPDANKDRVTHFYIVVEGIVDIYSDNGGLNYTASEGMEFGMVGILTDLDDFKWDTKGSAMARTDVTMLAISRESFQEALHDNHSLALALVESLARHYLEGIRDNMKLRERLVAAGIDPNEGVNTPVAAARSAD